MKPLTQHINRTVRVDSSQIVENALANSFLTADMAVGTTLTVKDITGFAIAKYVWINPFQVNSEIIAMHASTAPTGSTLTLAATTVFAHATGEPVYYVEFNQVEVSHSATLTGSKSVLATNALLAREKETIYLDTTQTTGYYFARYKDSVAGTFGSYADGVTYDGWATNTVGYMIQSAMSELSIELSEKVSMDDCIRWVNKGLHEIKGKVRRWTEHFVYNYAAGQTSRGVNVVAMPSNIYDTESNLSIEQVRIGNDSSLIYLDPGSFDAQQDDVIVTQVTTQQTAGGVTLAIDNSYDFADSGTVHVYIAGTQYSIEYTGVTRSATAGVLTGIPASGDGSITVTIPVDTYVWQNEEEGIPTFYTVRNGQIEYYPLVDADNDNQNIYLDYNTEVTEVNSQGDEIDYQRFDMLEAYLTWRMWCKSSNDGVLDKTSGFYTTYKEYLNDAIRIMPTHKTRTAPNLNRMMRRHNRRVRPEITPEYS